MFTKEELAKVEHAISDKPNFKTSTGFTGNKKTKKDKKNFVVGKKRRRTDHLTNKERKQLASLHQQVDQIMVENSYISHKDEDKITKKDMKKGKNSNLGAEGIHGTSTFLKYKKISKTFVKYCFEHYEGIEHISDIKPGMYLDWVEGMAINGKKGGGKYSAKTIGLYITAIKKLTESADKAGVEFERLTQLGEKHINTKVDEIKEKHGIRYFKKDYKRGKKKITSSGEVIFGYSYKEAQKITKKAYELSPYYGLLYEVLSHACPRHEELMKIKWRQVDIENNCIYLDDPNQTKTNRPRFVPIPAKTSEKFKSLMEAGLFKNPDTRIWGSRLTEDDLYNLTRHLCRESHVGYSGIHDFRRAATEYHIREIKKGLEKGKVTREELEQRFLGHVNADPKLKPIEIKKEKERDENGKVVLVPVLDKNGNPRFYPNGKPRREANWIPKLDENGNYVKDFRYTPEEVTEWRIDKLINAITSQILGHNRTDASSPYKNG
jgi:integrase